MNQPIWWRILNKLPFTDFNKEHDNRWQLKSYDTLNKIAPDLYDAAGQEVKEFNTYHRLNGNSFDKVKLGKRVCSIPFLDAFYHPELLHDKKALEKYLKEHPECRAESHNKFHE